MVFVYSYSIKYCLQPEWGKILTICCWSKIICAAKHFPLPIQIHSIYVMILQIHLPYSLFLFLDKELSFLKRKITSCSQWRTQNVLKNYKKEKVLELYKRITMSKPHTLDQSDKVCISTDCSCSWELSKFSQVCLLPSFHMIHIKHDGTRFQMSDECSLNQFLQPNNKAITVQGKTQWIPIILKMTLHILKAILQSSNKWSTVSALH